MGRTVDAYGRIQYDTETLFRFKLEGRDIGGLFSQPDDAAEEFNRLCTAWDKPHMRLPFPPPIEISPQEEHARRQQEWLVPFSYMEIDVAEHVYRLCADEAQIARCQEELELFERHGLLPVLRACIYLVEYFRTHQVVWGVGRGSSVASYVLFKIGIHRIDSMRFGLDIKEFLKDKP